MANTVITLDGATTVVSIARLATRVVVASGAQGPVGRTGGGASAVTTYWCAEAIGGHRLVTLGEQGLRYADARVVNDAATVIGMSVAATAQNQYAEIVANGEIEEPSWNWTLNQPVFLGQNGIPTQAIPTMPSAFSLIVGFPVTPTRLFVSLREPLIL